MKKTPKPIISTTPPASPSIAKSTSINSDSPSADFASPSAGSISHSTDSVPHPTDSTFPANPWVYSDTVKEHFLNPRNFLMGDETKYQADATGIVGNPICGDQMKMFLKIDPKTDKIIDVKWKTYGCASAIASTSALSELAKGKTLDEALAIDAKMIEDYLGGLPKHKFHCSVLGHDALRSAIAAYRKSK